MSIAACHAAVSASFGIYMLCNACSSGQLCPSAASTVRGLPRSLRPAGPNLPLLSLAPWPNEEFFHFPLIFVRVRASQGAVPPLI